jgi:UDP-N-acetyl-D-galactosamine dehydrogenase
MTKLEKKIGIIGLGYVGLPLAVAFAEKYKVIGFDIDTSRVEELNSGRDETLEIEEIHLLGVLDTENNKKYGLHVTTRNDKLSDCNIYIVTVPTPTDKNNRPDLFPMLKASEIVGSYLKYGDIVIYESTVYPGVTEEEMVPVLEKSSGLKFNQDFFCGYSPERINPGDKKHTVTKILKITSGSDNETAEVVDQLYKSIITAGTHKAPCIKVAEAAKVIENSQRDINIAFINELSKIFNLMGIDTHAVLDAARTKWNFLPFNPGIVGGHCIGVDPYYLAQKAQELNYHPEIILAGRRINDSMGKFISGEVVKLMIKKNIGVKKSKILILGFSFKENCPDFRNTKVIDIYRELLSYEADVDIYDPWVNSKKVMMDYNVKILDQLIDQKSLEKYSAIILAVSHDLFKKIQIKSNSNLVVFDVKGILPVEFIDSRL